jgi:hypothetical protein
MYVLVCLRVFVRVHVLSLPLSLCLFPLICTPCSISLSGDHVRGIVKAAQRRCVPLLCVPFVLSSSARELTHPRVPLPRLTDGNGTAWPVPACPAAEAARAMDVDEQPAAAPEMDVDEQQPAAEAEPAAEPAKHADAGGKAGPSDPSRIRFKLMVQSNTKLLRAAQQRLDYLKEHAIITIDLGMVLVLAAVVSCLEEATVIECEDGSADVEMKFAYRQVRVSGRHYNRPTRRDTKRGPKVDSASDVPAPVAPPAGLHRFATDLFADIADPSFTTATADEKVAKLGEMMMTKPVDWTDGTSHDHLAEALGVSLNRVLDGHRPQQREARFRHQQRIALDFANQINEICLVNGLGTAFVVVGDVGAAANGGRHRPQVDHDVIINVLKGFFTPFFIDEVCFSRSLSSSLSLFLSLSLPLSLPLSLSVCVSVCASVFVSCFMCCGSVCGVLLCPCVCACECNSVWPAALTALSCSTVGSCSVFSQSFLSSLRPFPPSLLPSLYPWEVSHYQDVFVLWSYHEGSSWYAENSAVHSL